MVCVGSYSSADKQSVYSTATDHMARFLLSRRRQKLRFTVQDAQKMFQKILHLFKVNSQLSVIGCWSSRAAVALKLKSKHLSPVGWGCRIHRLHLCIEVRHHYQCPEYDTKQSNCAVPVMLGHWGMWSTPSLPLLSGSLWPGMVAPDRVLSIGKIELNCILMLNWVV